jgi:hypothetical protein
MTEDLRQEADYLWDRSGAPDPHVERLEHVLGRWRYDRPMPALPARAGAHPRRATWIVSLLSAAATLALVVAAARSGLNTSGAWHVERVAGLPRVGAAGVEGRAHVRPGEWVETDATSRALIDVGLIGQVEVQPNTRLQVRTTRPEEHRLALDRGTIDVFIWAPPLRFFVDTVSAVAVDLGCAYTLRVDDSGAGLLRVTSGWVGFELEGRESFIPAGAVCETRPRVGPGTPHYADTSEAFARALATLDFGVDAPARVAALDIVLAEARPRDAVSLWHLLTRLDGEGRARVYDRMAALVPPPAGVSRGGILAGDARMRDLWWNALGLETAEWWRLWKSAWPKGR